jgi:phytoene dehydrogenase-like protein
MAPPSPISAAPAVALPREIAPGLDFDDNLGCDSGPTGVRVPPSSVRPSAEAGARRKKGEKVMAQKRVLIIGAGIAGLCTGVYLRRSGFDTEILEMHTIPGGLATAWKKGGFVFENCIHWLVGSKPGGYMNDWWKEVFDIGRLTFYDPPVYQVVERGTESVSMYTDPDRLESELLEKAPEDSAAVKEFVGFIRKLTGFRFPMGDSLPAKLADWVRMIPYLPLVARYRKMTMGDFARRFRSPLLRGFFAGGLPEMSYMAVPFSLAWMAQKDAGYPIGGSLKMIGLIADSYKDIGGRIRFKARVERILVEDNRAVGVRLAGGEEVRADVVVSAADGHATIFDFLEGNYLDDRIRRVYDTYKLFPSYVQVSMGVAADLAGAPGFLSLFLDRELEIDPGTRKESLSFRIFNYDPTFAPAGQTAVVCFIATYNHEYWLGLRQRDKKRYEAEKKRLAEAVTAVFRKRFPKAKGKVKVVDVATPASVIRYTGNWKGSMEGWLMTPATGIKTLPSVLPGLKNFYMVGQWISPGGGLPSGLMTGRTVSRRIAQDNGVRWLQ